jgi:hypothetical protein
MQKGQRSTRGAYLEGTCKKDKGAQAGFNLEGSRNLEKGAPGGPDLEEPCPLSVATLLEGTGEGVWPESVEGVMPDVGVVSLLLVLLRMEDRGVPLRRKAWNVSDVFFHSEPPMLLPSLAFSLARTYRSTPTTVTVMSTTAAAGTTMETIFTMATLGPAQSAWGHQQALLEKVTSPQEAIFGQSITSINPMHPHRGRPVH